MIAHKFQAAMILTLSLSFFPIAAQSAPANPGPSSDALQRAIEVITQRVSPMNSGKKQRRSGPNSLRHNHNNLITGGAEAFPM